jgi:hypothetical protein
MLVGNLVCAAYWVCADDYRDTGVTYSTVQYSTVIVGGDPKPRHQPVLLAVCDPVSHNGDYAAPAAELLVLGCSSTDPFVMVLGCFQ